MATEQSSSLNKQKNSTNPAWGPRYEKNASSDEIRRDIDRTRHEMDETIDELEARAHPRHLLDDLIGLFQSKKGDAKHSAKDAGQFAVDKLKHHPVPAALIGAGIAWMIAEEAKGERYPHRRRKGYEFNEEPPMYAGSYVDARTGEPYDLENYGADWTNESAYAEGDGQPGAKDRIKGKLAEGKAKAGDKAHRAREKGAHMSEAARHRARAAGARARRGYRQGRDTFLDTMEEYPLAVGAAALAAGVFAGLALPSTEREDEMIGGYSDEFKHRARERGAEAWERSKHVAAASANAAAEEAEHQGLSPEQLEEKAKREKERLKQASAEAREDEHRESGSIADRIKSVADASVQAAKDESKKQKDEFRAH